MGVVYRAHDQKLDRFVALKFLPRHLPNDHGDEFAISFAERKRRFMDEAKAASSLDHANICTIYDINETDDGQLFIAMAWYEGETLKAKIARGPLGVDDVVGYGTQILAGLAEAHARGLVHRDIKPANVMVTDDGVVKILDFGLSKFSADGPSDLSSGNRLIGTAAYMSPEQVNEASVDHQSDLWATGVVLYEMTTARRPFRGANDLSVLYAVINHEPDFPAEAFRGVSHSLRAIIETALARDRLQRFPTAEAFNASLEALNSDSSSVTLAITTVRWLRRRRFWRRRALQVLAVVVAMLVVGFGWQWRNRLATADSSTVVVDPATVVALGFQNQSAEDDQWVCTALTDLATFLVPGDGSTLRWLAPTDAEAASLQDEAGYDENLGLASSVRSAVANRTHGARALTGRCRVLGDTGQVEIDVRLEDLHEGAAHGRSAYAGDQSELISVAVAAMSPLAPLLGGEIRAAEPSWSMPALSNASRPLLVRAQDALRRLDAPQALGQIQAALRLQPFHPQLLAVQAETLLRLGRIRDARTAADRALRAVRHAPLSLQAHRHARVLEAAGVPARAAAMYKALWPTEEPADTDASGWIDRGFELARLLALDGQETAVNGVLERLRTADGDPRRIALIEATAARQGARNQDQLEAALRGSTEGSREEAPLLWARARYLEAEPRRRIGQQEGALEALRDARAVFAAHHSALGEADTWMVEGVILWDQQDLSGAKNCYETAAHLYQSLGDDGRYGRSLQNLALIEGQLGDVAVAASLFRQALDLYGETTDRIAEVTTWFNLAELMTHAGRLDEAADAYRQALQSDATVESLDTHAALYSSYGEFLLLRGDLVEADRWLSRALGIFESAGDRLPLARAERRIARLRLFQGDPQAARAAVDRAIDQFSDTDVGAFRAHVLERSSEIHLASGDLAAASQALMEATKSLGSATDTRPAGEVRLTRAIFQLEREDTEGALVLARRAAETLRGSGSVLELARAHGVIASALLDAQQIELAHEELVTARGLLKGIEKIPAYELPVALVEARLVAARGAPDEAGRQLRDLLIRCKSMGAGHLELQVGLALARVELSSGNPAAGRSRLRQVERDASRNGLGWLLQKAQALSQG